MADKATSPDASASGHPTISNSPRTTATAADAGTAEVDQKGLNVKRPRDTETPPPEEASEASLSPNTAADADADANASPVPPRATVTGTPPPVKLEDATSSTGGAGATPGAHPLPMNAAPLTPSTAERKKNPTASNTNLGRRGDARMHRAVAARLDDPSLSLLEALIAGGFSFPQGTERSGVSDRNVYDSDNVLLCQRKNQLSRRLRLAKKSQQNGATIGANGQPLHHHHHHHVLKKPRVDDGPSNGHGMSVAPGLQGYMHPSFAATSAFNPAAGFGVGGLSGGVGGVEGPSRAHELMQMVLNSSQNSQGVGVGAPFLQDRRSLGGHHNPNVNVMDFNGVNVNGVNVNGGGPMGTNDMGVVDRSGRTSMDPHSQTHTHTHTQQQFQNLGNDIQNSFLHPQGRFIPPGGQQQLFLGGQLPQMNPYAHQGAFAVQGNNVNVGGGGIGGVNAPVPSSSDQLMAQPSQQGTNGVRSNDLDRYLEIYSNSVGMDRDQFQSMMMNRQNQNQAPAAAVPPNVNPSAAQQQQQQPARTTTNATAPSPANMSNASPPPGGESKAEKDVGSVKSETSTLEKKDGSVSSGNRQSQANDSQMMTTTSSNGTSTVTGNGDATSKLNQAMKVYKMQHKALIQDCLVAAGFDQTEVEENSRLYSDFEEIIKTEAV